MPRPHFTSIDIALYSSVVLAWGFSWIALHYQVGVVAPEISIVWRFLMATPLMFVIAAWRGERLFYSLREHIVFVALGVTLFGVNFTLFYYGAKFITSGLLAVVFSLASVINVWLGALTLNAGIDRRVAAGGVLGVLGVAAMFYPQLADTQFEIGVLIGLALCVGGTLSFCIGNMISARLQRHGITVFAASGWGMIYGSVALAGFAYLRGEAFIIDPRLPYIASLIYLTLIGSVVAFASYLTLLGRIGADRAAYSTVMFPVVALLVSTFAEGYRWTLPATLGLLAVLAGNLLVLRPARPKDVIRRPAPLPIDCRARR
ncbi:MAG: EamA family transporter [Rhizobiales bacterium]|nr:EamA family transporter [Hyphomicrobiales bacterium]